MSQFRVYVFMLLFCGIGITAGCNRSGGTAASASNANRGVAVIDLDEVAKRLGRDVVMQESLQQAAGTLNQQFAAIQASYESKFEETKSEVGEAPTDEQAQQLNALGQQLNLRLNQTRQVAQTKLSQHRLQLINLFREEVKPIARQVAKERGLDVVVSKNDTVIFAFTPAADITEQVIERMIAAAPAHVKPSAATTDRVERNATQTAVQDRDNSTTQR